ncbi:DMT family transporter [Candidatus Woesearchaeota archaeon]|nr:DMT family transporter [Candidatus Woesearchaeota archaeon]
MIPMKKAGIIFVVFASVCWAIETVTAKFSFAYVDFLQIVFQQGFYCFLTVLVFSLLTRNIKRDELKNISKKDLLSIIFIGIIGSFIAYPLFYYGVTKTSAVNANLLAHTQPIFVAILGFILLKERLSNNDIIGGLLLFISAVLVSSRTFGNIFRLRLLSFGDLIVLCATVCWAIVVIPGKKLLERLSPNALVIGRFFISSILLAALLVTLGRFSIFSVYGVTIGLVTGTGYVLYYNGLKILKSAQTAMIELATPFFTTVLAFFVLDEVLSFLQVIGFLLLILGVYFISKNENI